MRRLQSSSGGARRLDDDWKAPDGNLARAFDGALTHDFFDDRVAAAAARSGSRSVPDLFEGAGSPEGAGTNGSVGHGLAMANDHGEALEN